MKQFILIAWFAVLLWVGGCTSPATIPGWKKAVERYVVEQGNGDPAILGSTRGLYSRPGFAIISEVRPERATDANGLLLGHRLAGGAPRFIYLVGLMHQQEVRDIRLAALRVDGSEFHWLITDPDEAALETYRRYRESVWRSRLSGRQTPPWGAMRFPGEEDQFDVSISDEAIAVTHRQSGAVWRLPLFPEKGSG
jgi:hypothetical protein